MSAINVLKNNSVYNITHVDKLASQLKSFTELPYSSVSDGGCSVYQQCLGGFSTIYDLSRAWTQAQVGLDSTVQPTAPKTLSHTGQYRIHYHGAGIVLPLYSVLKYINSKCRRNSLERD